MTFGVLVLAGAAQSIVLYDPLALMLFSGVLLCLSAASLKSLQFYRTATAAVLSVAAYGILFGGPFLLPASWLIAAPLAYLNAAGFHLYLNRIAPGWIARSRVKPWLPWAAVKRLRAARRERAVPELAAEIDRPKQ